MTCWCLVEWYEVNYEAMGDGHQPSHVRSTITPIHNASLVGLIDSQNTFFPLGSSPGNLEDSQTTDSAPCHSCSKEELFHLVFEVHSEVVDLKFSMEQLNKCISRLVDLHANTTLQHPVFDLFAQDAILLHVPIPLLISNQPSSQNDQVSPNV